MKTCRLSILCLHVFNTQYLHLLQVDMQGLSSSSTAGQSWRPKVTPTHCLKDVVIQLYVAGVHRFRETKPYTVARLTLIVKINIAACPYITKGFILHAPSGKHQVTGRFTCYSRTVGSHPSGGRNLEVVPRFYENLCTPAL